MIPMVDLKRQYHRLKHQIHSNIQNVLEHGKYISGPEVQTLEKKLAEYTGSQHCITIASGTTALLISLMAINIKPGDEIITTPFTFAATAEVIKLLGAIPIFVDIKPDTYHINPELIESAITSKTRAIIPVSLFGQPADMEEINALAKQYNLIVIEDAAQSFGAMYKGTRSCNLSAIACTSFFPSKPLGCYGDGGAIFTNDNNFAQIVQEIRNHGQHTRYYHTRIGVNGRLDTLQCAILLAKLEIFEEEIKQRQMIGKEYLELLSHVPQIKLPTVLPDRSSVWAQFTIQIPNRDFVVAELNKLNIQSTIHYPISLEQQPAYKTQSLNLFLPSSNKVSGEVLSLPICAYLKKDTQEKIVENLIKILDSESKLK